jgi:hypothetical protein
LTKDAGCGDRQKDFRYGLALGFQELPPAAGMLSGWHACQACAAESGRGRAKGIAEGAHDCSIALIDDPGFNGGKCSRI